MISYFFPLIFLSILTLFESRNEFTLLLKNKFLYFVVFLIFLIFICFRYQIGCDWDNYEELFKRISSYDFDYLIKNQGEFFDLGYITLAKLVSYKFDHSMLIFLYGTIFTIPLFILCYSIKRTYLSLLISYPYFIVLVGMGPIRQAAAIGFLILSVLLIAQKRKILSYIFSILSILFHQSAFFFNTLIILFTDKITNRKIDVFVRFLLYSIIFILFINNFSVIYDKFYNYLEVNAHDAKGTIFVWILNFFPSLIYLLFEHKFSFKPLTKKIIKLFSIFVIIIFPIVFIRSTIAYRLLLYSFPSNIYIVSYFHESKLFGKNNLLITSFIILLSFLSLFVWLNFAYHSYCWIPYQNILFKL